MEVSVLSGGVEPKRERCCRPKPLEPQLQIPRHQRRQRRVVEVGKVSLFVRERDERVLLM